MWTICNSVKIIKISYCIYSFCCHNGSTRNKSVQILIAVSLKSERRVKCETVPLLLRNTEPIVSKLSVTVQYRSTTLKNIHKPKPFCSISLTFTYSISMLSVRLWTFHRYAYSVSQQYNGVECWTTSLQTFTIVVFVCIVML